MRPGLVFQEGVIAGCLLYPQLFDQLLGLAISLISIQKGDLPN